LAALSRSLRNPRVLNILGWAGLAGVLLAAASLTRVTAVVVLTLVAAAGLFIRPRSWLSSAVVVLVAAGLLGPWILRTSALVGRPAFVESLAGYNFWLGEAADRDGFAEDFGQARSRAHELMAIEAGTPETRSPSFWYATLSPRQARVFDDTLVEAGLKRIGDRPMSYLGRCASGLVWFWIRADTERRTIQYALVALPLLALGLFGLTKLLARPEREALPTGLVAAVVALHILIYAAVCPMARYSVQVYPLICYLAGAGFAFPSRRRVAHGQPTS
jgi:4-amino-4-deoxy-L-arabinose transferase-like glycosyltransferase